MARPKNSVERIAQDAKLRALLRANPGREFSQQEIANEIGCTRQAIASIEQRALRKLRNWTNRFGKEWLDK